MSLLKSRTTWVMLAVVAVVGLGVFAFWPSAEPVEMVEVDRREVVELYVATGELRARHSSDIAPEIGGVVDSLPVRAGDRVERGDVLAELRPQDAKLAIDRAEAQVRTAEDELRQARTGATDAEIDAAKARVEGAESTLAQAKRELDRAERLHAKGLTTDADLEKARTAVEQAESQLGSAKAELERLRELPKPSSVRVARSRLQQAKVELEEARSNFDKTTLRAPFDGLVTSVDADPGERVGPGGTVVRVADMETLEIYAEIDEDFFGRVVSGDEATLILPSMPDETFSATVKQVGPEIDPDRGVVGIHLEPDDLPERVFPGLTVDVNIEIARLDDATAVPAEAVAQDDRGAYVLTIVDGRARRTPVRIAARGETFTAIEPVDDKALETGSLVIRQAAKNEPGSAVEAAPASAEAR